MCEKYHLKTVVDVAACLYCPVSFSFKPAIELLPSLEIQKGGQQVWMLRCAEF